MVKLVFKTILLWIEYFLERKTMVATFEPSKDELKDILFAAEKIKQTYDNPTHEFENEQIVYEIVDSEVYIYIAGSNDLTDWGENFATKQVKFRDDMYFSRGFLNAAYSIHKYLYNNNMLHRGKHYHIVGHSKGGAVAVILGAILTSKHFKVFSVNTINLSYPGFI